MSNKQFFDGIYFNKPSEKAPEFIIGKLSINADKLIEFLNSNREYVNNKGYIRGDIKEGRSGKIYIEVDTYGLEEKPQEKASGVEYNYPEQDYPEGYPTPDSEGIDTSEVPF